MVRLSLPDGTVKVVKDVGDVKLWEDIWMLMFYMCELLQGSKMKFIFDDHGCTLHDPATGRDVVEKEEGIKRFCMLLRMKFRKEEKRM